MSDEIRVVDDVLPPALFDQLAQSLSRDAARRASRQTGLRGTWASILAVVGDQFGLPIADLQAGQGRTASLAGEDRNNLADISFRLTGTPARDAVAEGWRLVGASLLKDYVLIGCGYGWAAWDGAGPEVGPPGERTIDICLNERWAPDWVVETVFLGKAGEEVARVASRPNRAVIYPTYTRRAQSGALTRRPAPQRTLTYRTRRRRGRDFEDLSDFLREHGALDCPHFVGTLHDHLLRTFQLLHDRGHRREVCLGGGLHAVYGTSLLRHSLLQYSDRALVSERFGAAAEYFAYLFSALDRPRTLSAPPPRGAATAQVELRDGKSLELARRDFDDLRNIECANLADQDSLKDYPPLIGHWNDGGAQLG